MSALLVPRGAVSMSMAASTVALEPASRLAAEVVLGEWAPKSADNLTLGLDAWVSISDRFALTFDGMYFKERPYEVTSSVGSVSGSFTPGESYFSLGCNFKEADFLSFELKPRMFMSSLAPDFKGNAFGADLIARYHGNGFNLAAGACNLGTPIKYGAGCNSYPMPSMVKLGGSYSYSGLTAAAEVDYLFSGALMAGLGLEYNIEDIAYVRAGYHYGDAFKTLPSFASAGLGLQYSGVRLNFGYVFAEKNIGGSFLLGLSYSF